MAIRLKRSGLTYQDYLQLPDDGQRYEIIDGELYVSPAPNTKHQRVAGRLFRVLADHSDSAELGEVFIAPYDLKLGDPSIVQPDILYISWERHDIVTRLNAQGAPDLVIEIISPSSTRMDLEIKRDLYARHGIPHYWVAHPEQEWLRAYALGADGQYELVTEGHGDMTFSAPLFPNLTIPLAKLWAERPPRSS
jgi:Uma2 family endonuclease